jgi:hypothetical protein
MSEKLTSESTCKKKTPYSSKAEAARSMRVLKKSGKFTGDTHNLKPYLCNICNRWHIGHRYDDVEDIFKQLEESK